MSTPKAALNGLRKCDHFDSHLATRTGPEGQGASPRLHISLSQPARKSTVALIQAVKLQMLKIRLISASVSFQTQGVQPSYSKAKLSRFVASFMMKSTCSETVERRAGSGSLPSNFVRTLLQTLMA